MRCGETFDRSRSVFEMGAPAVTVIMPVFNGEKYIRGAIESILNQTLPDYEFLIIDDGSSDTGMDIARSYRDERIRILLNGRNLGIEESLNLGIREARGRYIARMDVDDISLPYRLERQFAFMEAQEDVAACGAWVKHFGSVSSLSCPPADSGEIRCGLLFGNVFSHPTIFLRRDVLLKNSYFYEAAFHAAEDYDLLVRIAMSYRLANLPEILLLYRRHDGQVSEFDSAQQRKSAMLIRQKQLKNLLPDITEKETLLFNSVAEKTSGSEIELLEGIRLLFERMIEANRTRKIYEHGILYRKLFGAWWRQCNICCVEGIKAWRIYRKSFLSAGRFDSLKLLLKCCMRYGK